MDDTQWKFRRTPGIVARRVAGETVLVPLDVRTTNPASRAAELFVLNETGELLWECLAAPSGADDLARNLIAAYDVAPDRARADSESFLRSMREIGAVAIAGSA